MANVSKWRDVLAKPEMAIALPVAVLLVTFAVFAVSAPDYFSAGNLQQLARDYTAPAFAALAMAIVIMAGGIDLSVGATFAIADLAMLYFFGIHELPLAVAVVGTLAVGALIGLTNGLLISHGRARPFLATLAMLLILRASYELVVHALTVPLANAYYSTPSWEFLGGGAVVGVPSNFLVLAVVGTTLHAFLTRSRPGAQLLATGGGRVAALNAGVPIRARLCLAYVLSAVLMSVAGILYAARQGSASSDTGQGMELVALSAIVLGGIPLSGGRGSISRALIGAGIQFLLLSGLLRLNVPGSLQSAISGALLLGAAALFISWDTFRVRHATQSAASSISAEVQEGIDMPAAIAAVNKAFDAIAIPVMQLQAIGMRFGANAALSHLDLSLYPGEIHALIGENGAGKSTLGKIACGALIPTDGRILLNGSECHFESPLDAIKAGATMVYQESSLVPTMTVAQNLMLGREPWFYSHKHRAKTAIAQLNALNYAVDPDTRVEDLSAAQRQLVELARAISMNPRLIVFDEPTASLSANEAKVFYKLMGELSRRDVAIVLVTHALEEALEHADRITVLRDGHRIQTRLAEAYNRKELIRLMVGREIANMNPDRVAAHEGISPVGSPILSIKNIWMGNKVRGMSFDLNVGEVLGLAGLVGAGRTETARIIAGALRPDSKAGGAIRIRGQIVAFESPRQATRLGVAYVTEDRAIDGLFDGMSVDDNIYISFLAAQKGWRFRYSSKDRKRLADQSVATFSIRMLDRNAAVGAYSGGNQQKIVTAMALVQQPELIIFDEPTRGVDVGAIPQIHQTIRSLAQEGKGVILISSYLPEILSVSDRIVVAYRGTNNGEYRPHDVDQGDLLEASLAKAI